MNSPFRSLARFAALALGACVSTAAPADTAPAYPSKPIRLIVPVAPGGGTDFTARLLAEEMAKRLGQSIVVENQPGGSGNIGVHNAVRAQADGYTLVMPITSFPINATLHKRLPFDTRKDLAPIALAASLPLILVVNPALPANSVAELIALAKQQPGQLNFANSGVGTTAHLSGELFERLTGTDLTSVAYKGGGPAVTDLLGGHVQMYFSTPSAVLPLIETGKLRALAVTSKHRLEELPDVPTFIESGMPDLHVTAWFGLFAPAGTPPEVIATLNQAANQSLQEAKIRQQMAIHSFHAEGSMTPAELGVFLNSEIQRWGAVIRELNLSVS